MGISWDTGSSLPTSGLPAAKVTASATSPTSSALLLCDSTAGALTLTLSTPAATATVEQVVILDAGTNVVTIAGSIDGGTASGILTSVGDRYRFLWDGGASTWRVAEVSVAPWVFASSGNWTAPAGVRAVGYDIISAAHGGGGGGSTAVATTLQAAGGGSAAGYRQRGTSSVTPGTAYPIEVGAGGAGGAGGASGGNAGANGGYGGSSSAFGVSAFAGTASGNGGSAPGGGSAASSATQGTGSLWHVPAASPVSSSEPGAGGSGYNEAPRDGLYGGSAGGAASSTNGGGAPTPPDGLTDSYSHPGANGGSSTTSGAATPNTTAPGCGGCGGAGGAVGGAGAAGGAGGPGQVTVWAVA